MKPLSSLTILLFILLPPNSHAADSCPETKERNLYQLANNVAQGLLGTLSKPAGAVGFSIHCDQLLSTTEGQLTSSERAQMRIKRIQQNTTQYPQSKHFKCIKANLQILDIVEFGSLHYGFSKKIVSLTNDRLVQKYLKDLEAELEKPKSPPMNLWTMTLQHPATKGNPEKAFELLGVLFADLSAQRHLGILEDGEHKNRLSRLGKKLFRLVGEGKVEPYPPTVAGQKNKSIYHFYTIGYVAQELKKRENTEGMSFLAATMVNYRYETLLGLDPEDKLSEDDREDIYLGYAGALYALGHKARIETPKDFKAPNTNLRTPAFVRQASQLDRTDY
jgi:hypothetical protein